MYGVDPRKKMTNVITPSNIRWFRNANIYGYIVNAHNRNKKMFIRPFLKKN